MGWVFGELRDVKVYVTGLEVSPKERLRFWQGWEFTWELTTNVDLEDRRVFIESAEFNIIGTKDATYRQVIG